VFQFYVLIPEPEQGDIVKQNLVSGDLVSEDWTRISTSNLCFAQFLDHVRVHEVPRTASYENHCMILQIIKNILTSVTTAQSYALSMFSLIAQNIYMHCVIYLTNALVLFD